MTVIRFESNRETLFFARTESHLRFYMVMFVHETTTPGMFRELASTDILGFQLFY